jgi:hypothetical protein
MSVTTLHNSALRYAGTAKAKNWDFGLWLMIVLPVVGLLVCLAFGLKSYGGDDLAAPGYDQWLPASVQADARGQ